MVKRCFYCREEIEEGSVVDMCMNCMYQVWGEKMAKAIIDNMEGERDKGNLELGRVGEKFEKKEDTNREIVEEIREERSGEKNTNIFVGAGEIIENINDSEDVKNYLEKGQNLSF